jgi:hypothetical protein
MVCAKVHVRGARGVTLTTSLMVMPRAAPKRPLNSRVRAARTHDGATPFEQVCTLAARMHTAEADAHAYYTMQRAASTMRATVLTLALEWCAFPPLIGRLYPSSGE